MSLMKYQEPHVQRLIDAFNNGQTVIDGSETGTGKTYTACYIAKKLGLKPIIICPRSVITPWRKVLDQFKTEYYGISNYESIRNAKWFTPDTPDTKTKTKFITKLGANDFKWELPDDAIIIFDEAHRCKNASTINSKLLTALKPTNNKVMLLSATIADKPKLF